MAAVIPLRPFQNAIDQARRAGHPEWRPHCIASVHRDLRLGRNGHAVAGQLQAMRGPGHSTASPTGGAA